MRYSVVLPRIEPTDAEEARRALDSAHELWARGEQRAALEQVRHAAESADAVGQRVRALALSRAVQTLAKGIGAASVRPPEISETPAVSSPRLRAAASRTAAAVTEPPPVAPVIARDMVPAKPVRAASPESSIAPASGPVRYAAAAPEVVISSPPAAMPAQAAPPEAAPAATLPLVDSVEDAELVVTVAPANWALESPNALVGHRAQRVAVAPGRGPGGTLMVRPLAAGEVAPKGSIVAVMVALEPDGLPLTRAG